jgi:hypothetical protein
MEARILGAVLRAESKVQCRFNTAYLSMTVVPCAVAFRASPALDLPSHQLVLI